MDVGIYPERPDEKEIPFGRDDTGDDEGEAIPMTSTSTHDKTYTFHYETAEEEETSFMGDKTPLIDKELNIDDINDSMNEAWVIISGKFPKADPGKFVAKIDDFGRLIVRLIRSGSKFHLLFKSNGEVNDKLPKTITKALGPPAEEVIRSNEETNLKLKERVKKIGDQT